ncbi:MAG: IclR family transcriptional regulator [Propioniciclava sp.]
MRTAQWNEPVSVLDRILAIIEALGADGGSQSISELAERTQLPKSTVSRLVAEMVDKRYLVRTSSGVSLGLRLFELGARANPPRKLRELAHPVLTELHRATGERVILAVRLGSDMLKITSIPGRIDVGALRAPARTTATGKAWLAHDAGSEPRESTEDADRAFHAELAGVRTKAFAFDREQTFPGVVSVGCAVLSATRTPVAALAVSGPPGLMDPVKSGQLVRAAASTLSRRFAAAS